MRALLALLLAAACREPRPPITDCTSDLGGVWRADSAGRAYHLLDRGVTKPVELFPMWDTTRLADGRKPQLPPVEGEAGLSIRSPLRLVFPHRTPEALAGTASLRVTIGGRTCRVSWPARLTGCAQGRAVLETREPPDDELATCAVDPAPAPNRVPLRRE